MEEFALKNNKTTPKTIKYLFMDLDGNVVRDKIKIIATIRGTYFISDKDDDRVGKIENVNGRDRFFIKTVKYGSPGEIVSDPFNNNIQEAYLDTDTRSKSYEYISVSKETFDIYQKYLYTKNSTYLAHINRRLNNGEA